MSQSFAVQISNLSKNFHQLYDRNQNTLGKVLTLVSPTWKRKEFLALDNVNLNIATGQTIGIIGRNGSGKSTLLKILANMYRPSSGSIQLNGRLFLMTNLASGLQVKLSVKDNIYLISTLMGLSQKQIHGIYDQIIEFSGLQKFVYAKTYQLSTGMKKRLSFSASIHCLEFINPDIILLDEIFGGGGDEDFKKKSLQKMKNLVDSRKTIILVSHKLKIISEYCNQVAWLDQGRIKMIGPTQIVIDKYLQEV